MFACEREGLGTRQLKLAPKLPSRVYFWILLKGVGAKLMLSTKIKGGSGASTNYVIRCAKNPKGGGGGGAKAPPGTSLK